MNGREASLAGIVLALEIIAVAARGQDSKIRLPNREIDPRLGVVEETLRSDPPPGGHQALLQFGSQSPLTVDDRDRLARLGIELQQYMGANAYLARVTRTPPWDKLLQRGELRWAGRLLPQDKIASPLWEAMKRDPARRTWRVAVHFVAGIAPGDVRALIRRYSTAPQRYGTLNVFALEVPKAQVEELASHPLVFMLEGIPDDQFPLAVP